MTEAKHARGPWTTAHDGHGGMYVGDGADRQVGFVSAHPQQAANARLIAAAPDLLAALQALSDALPSDEHMRAEGSVPGPGIVAMRAAIAKATS